jgi:ABC-2 type transport system permease protein
MSTVFKTLLQREWMQHHRVWLVLMAIPFVLYLVGLSFGQVAIHEDEAGPMPAAVLMMGVTAGMMAATTGVILLAVLMQAPGLARRDHSDRSIEYWLSLPTPPSASVAATLLAHWVLLPVAAIALGFLAGLVAGPLTALRALGAGSLAEVPWGQLMLFGLLFVARVCFGFLLALFWLSPLLLGLMAAGAWLKRWGAPVFVAALALLHAACALWLKSDVVGRTLEALWNNARRSVLASGPEVNLEGLGYQSSADVPGLLNLVTPLLASDAADALRLLLQPLALLAVGGAAAAFALIVWKRRVGH